MRWYGDVFGFEEIGRWENDGGTVQNGEMRVGNTEIWLDGGGRRQPAEGDARPTWIGVWVDDPDEMHRQVTARDVTAEQPVTRDFGVRMLTVEDPFGYLWGFMCRVQE